MLSYLTSLSDEFLLGAGGFSQCKVLSGRALIVCEEGGCLSVNVWDNIVIMTLLCCSGRRSEDKTKPVDPRVLEANKVSPYL